jgi:putative spermidine/putrescine transport system substrate-binding protein
MQHDKHRFCRFNLLTGFLLMVFLSLTPIAGRADQWDDVLARAKGQTVDWFMWGGSPAVNTFVNGYLTETLKQRYDITLRQVPVQDISEVVGKILVEKQAGKTAGGQVDIMWINGENFRTCKRNGLLYGPFADKLPNQKLVDWSRASVRNDFGEPVDGLESPWGSAQVVMIHDTKRTPAPPKSMEALLDWIRKHPGRFAYPAPPDFTGSVFVRHVFYHAAGEVQKWQGGFDEQAYNQAAAKTFDLLHRLSPFLWRQGKTYPESPIRLAQLFADHEIDFCFSYHPAEASKQIHDGLFPDSVRTFVFDEGTIANTHFVAIPFNAKDKEGAMVLADFLISPEAQLKKADQAIWGDFPVIDPGRLDSQWQSRFDQLPKGIATLSNEVLQRHQLPEPPSEILIRLEKGWQLHVLKQP